MDYSVIKKRMKHSLYDNVKKVVVLGGTKHKHILKFICPAMFRGWYRLWILINYFYISGDSEQNISPTKSGKCTTTAWREGSTTHFFDVALKKPLSINVFSTLVPVK